MAGGLLVARRAGNRMSTRQTYRTFNRMERRREWLSGGSQSEQEQEPTYTAPVESNYVNELERLAQLHNQGILSAEEYDAKKRQVLGL